MPARTLDAEAATLSPLRYAAYSPTWGRVDEGDGDDDTVARPQMRFTRAPSDRGGYPMSPPMQRTDSIAWLPPSFGPSNMLMHPSLAPSWISQRQDIRIAPIQQPPPLLHKVWLLDCKMCGTFLTNRGMKAVLLLRPNVPLYSTDAMPINCSAHGMTAEAGTSASRPRSASVASPQDPAAARTCECLTQTLWCHGCGIGVGYMIVTPCHRCTSSTTSNNRTTNGHRFVFYSNGIAASERHYVPDELGVDVDAQLPSSIPQLPPMPGGIPPHRPRYVPPTIPSSPTPAAPRRASWSNPRHNATSPTLRDVQRLPMSPTSPASGILPSSPQSPVMAPDIARETPPRQPERLRAGDVVYWHHLIRSGEIPAVSDDPRARAPTKDEPVEPKPPVADTTKPTIQPVMSSRKMAAGR